MYIPIKDGQIPLNNISDQYKLKCNFDLIQSCIFFTKVIFFEKIYAYVDFRTFKQCYS
jgi:hypothetical protein